MRDQTTLTKLHALGLSAHAYAEDQLVEPPASGLFAELGWTVAGPLPNAGVAGRRRIASDFFLE